jgi:hypothetical protein
MEELAKVRGAAGLIAIGAAGAIVEVKNTPFMAAARRF